MFRFCGNRAAATLAFALLASPAWSQGTGSEGFFEIHNETTANVVVGFYTNDGTGWSDNWLSEDINPGEAVQAEFLSPSGDCQQYIRVGWLADDDESEILDDPITIDICDASRLFVGDNDVTYD